MSISSSNTRVTQLSFFETYVREPIQSNKQILSGLAIQALGLSLLQGNQGPLEKTIGILGVCVVFIGVEMTGLSQEQTYQKAIALMITGFVFLVSGVSFSAKSDKIADICVEAGVSVIYSGLCGYRTVEQIEIEREILLDQQPLDLRTNSSQGLEGDPLQGSTHRVYETF